MRKPIFTQSSFTLFNSSQTNQLNYALQKFIPSTACNKWGHSKFPRTLIINPNRFIELLSLVFRTAVVLLNMWSPLSLRLKIQLASFAIVNSGIRNNFNWRRTRTHCQWAINHRTFSKFLNESFEIQMITYHL